MRILEWLKWLWMLKSGPELDAAKNEEIREEAKEFSQQFLAEANLPYDWVYDFAKDKYEQMLKNLEQLDGKADAIIKYLGGGTAFVAAGVIVGANRSNALAILLMLPSVVLALCAIAYAIHARLPTQVPVPPRIDEALS